MYTTPSATVTRLPGDPVMCPSHFLNLEHVILCGVKKLTCVCVSKQKGSIPSSLTAQRAGAMVRGENSLESDNLCDLEQFTDFL